LVIRDFCSIWAQLGRSGVSGVGLFPPALPIGGFSQTAELTRFNGPFKWSIAEAPRVERFFSQTFGRRLPVTALGQSATHNRLGFDHRDSIDSLHPDSGEGQALSNYPRKSGILPAFRGGPGYGHAAYSCRPSLRPTCPLV
jgi:hypothetical protein